MTRHEHLTSFRAPVPFCADLCRTLPSSLCGNYSNYSRTEPSHWKTQRERVKPLICRAACGWDKTCIGMIRRPIFELRKPTRLPRYSLPFLQQKRTLKSYEIWKAPSQSSLRSVRKSLRTELKCSWLVWFQTCPNLRGDSWIRPPCWGILHSCGTPAYSLTTIRSNTT